MTVCSSILGGWVKGEVHIHAHIKQGSRHMLLLSCTCTHTNTHIQINTHTHTYTMEVHMNKNMDHSICAVLLCVFVYLCLKVDDTVVLIQLAWVKQKINNTIHFKSVLVMMGFFDMSHRLQQGNNHIGCSDWSTKWHNDQSVLHSTDKVFKDLILNQNHRMCTQWLIHPVNLIQLRFKHMYY